MWLPTTSNRGWPPGAKLRRPNTWVSCVRGSHPSCRTALADHYRAASRQIALAAKPDALLCFHLGHLKQTDQDIEVMTPRHAGKIGDGLRDEGHCFIRSAISGRIIGWRTPIPAP